MYAFTLMLVASVVGLFLTQFVASLLGTPLTKNSTRYQTVSPRPGPRALRLLLLSCTLLVFTVLLLLRTT